MNKHPKFKRWWRRQQNIGMALILGAYTTLNIGITKWPPPEERKAVTDLIEEIEQLKEELREQRRSANEGATQRVPAASTNWIQGSNSGFSTSLPTNASTSGFSSGKSW